MRINSIKIEKLFGIFDHDIQLKKEGITIIYGLNGYGKTTLLTLINAFFTGTYQKFFAFPFGKFYLELDDNSVIEIIQENQKEKIAPNLRIKHTQLKEDFIIEGKKIKSDKTLFPIKYLTDYIPDLEVKRYGYEWFDKYTGETLSRKTVYERFAYLLPKNYIEELNEPLEIIKLRNEISVTFIETHRFLVGVGKAIEQRTSLFPSIIAYSNELAESINSKFSNLGFTSLNQLFEGGAEQMLFDSLKTENLEKEKEELQEKMKILFETGLLPEKELLHLKWFDRLDSEGKALLISQLKEAVEIFYKEDLFAEKSKLFFDLINSHFKLKKLSFNKDKGVLFTQNETLLPNTSLSSGEQHLFILFYQLLFKVKPNSLVLIDEPEISLHIIWQEDFLESIKKIIELNSFQILIATHSPGIVNDDWDLTVKLKG